MTTLPYRLDRTISIRASRETVFRFFTDSARWARWWGAGSSIDPRPGGRVLIVYPGGVQASGEVLEMVAPERLRFTYGYATGQPFPPGSTHVSIRLDADGVGTRLRLSHELADAAPMEEHAGGWRYQLALFANLVSDEVNAGATDVADAWFRVWAEPDAAARQRALSEIASPNVSFRDRVGLVDGVADLVSHIGAAQRFMPGMRLERRGAVRHCQGMVLVDWVALSDGGETCGSGTNVFIFGAEGRIDGAAGFWNPPSAPNEGGRT